MAQSYSWYDNDEEDRSKLLSNQNHDDVVSNDLDHELTNITCSVEDSHVNLDTAHLNVVENFSSVVNIEVPIIIKDSEDDIQHATTNPSQSKDNDISDSSVLKDKAMNEAKNIAKDDLNHQKHAKKMKRSTSSASVSSTTCSAWRFKILIIFGACFITGCYLVPFTIYYVTQTGGNAEIDVYDKNASSIQLMKTCNFSDLACGDQILYTYEALRTINLPSSQQYCSERVETLFCDASMECNNESYVKDKVCQQVRQEYCTAEWRMLEVNQTDGLIVCEEYEETAPLNCSDQFDLANNGSVCLPLCEEFSTLPYVALYTVSSLISIAGGLIVIAISFKKRKKMFIFPQILIVFTAGVAIILQCLLLIPAVSIGRWNLLCSSKFLFDSLDNPTAFCTFQGTVIVSGSVIYSYLWNLYVVHLALKLFYPMKSDKLFKSDHRRKIFIAEVLIVFLIGTIPSILVATVGPNYKIATFPPIYCGSHGVSFLLLSVIPNLITSFVSHTLILLILYKLHMHGGIFKKKQGSVGKQTCTCQFTVPELKVTFVLGYFVFLTIILWTSFSARGDRFYDSARRFADCMAGGNRKDHDCRELREDLEAHTNPVIEVFNLMLLAFHNFASLPFVIQFQTIKNSLRQARQKVFSKCN